MYVFNSEKYSCLELLFKSTDECKSMFNLKSKNTFQKVAGNKFYKLLRFNLEKNTDYEIEFINGEISIAYLCGNDDILDDGVCFLEFDNGNINKYKKDLLKEFFNTPYKEQYHFSTYKNWLNDPNGLCWYKGKYHMYYQMNPNSQQWDNMYWGHTASDDLVHWVYLPIALEPQQEIIENETLKGGAFSGSAVALENEIIFYLTRHLSPKEDDTKTIEYQTMVSSEDSIKFGKEETVIENDNSHFSFNFRDPKVNKYNGKWYMVLGSTYDDIPAIICYTSDDMRSWKYTSNLIEEQQDGLTTIECPDLMFIDNKFIAVAGLMDYIDECGRINPTKYYIGNLKDNKLEVEGTGLYDFGSNFYAVQSFNHDGRTIAIGWISDFYKEHKITKNGTCGTMAIPRELNVKDNTLYMKPVKEIYSLLDKILIDKSKSNVVLEQIENNSYYVKIEFNKFTDFNILLMANVDSSISLVSENNILKIVTKRVKSEKISFQASLKSLETIEVFVDRRTVEVFVNDGQLAGTKVFYCESTKGLFKTDFEDLDAVDNVKVYSMKSIWY